MYHVVHWVHVYHVSGDVVYVHFSDINMYTERS